MQTTEKTESNDYIEETRADDNTDEEGNLFN